MKNVFFVVFLFVSLKLFAQHPIGTDSFQLQTVGNSNTLFKSKGAIGSDSGFVNSVYGDTALANLGKLKNYPGAQIRVGDSIWVRNSTATKWLNQSGSGTISGAWLLASGGLLTGSNTITQNFPNRLLFNGTYTTTATQQHLFEISPAITNEAVASDETTILKIGGTISRTASGQNEVLLDIAPVVSNNGFSGTTYGIRHVGSIIPAVTGVSSLGNASLVYASAHIGNLKTSIIDIYTGNTLTFVQGGATQLMRLIQGNSNITNTPGGTSLQVSTHGNLDNASNGYMIEAKGEIKSRGSSLVSVLSTPSAPTLAVQGTTGSTTISYKIVAATTTGYTTAASSATSVTNANATLTGSNYVQVSWTEVVGATKYDIYRTATNGTSPATTGKIGTFTSGSFNTFAFNDVGGAGDGTTPPTVNSTGTLKVEKMIGISSATLVPTALANTIENDGTHLYYTNNSAARFQLDQQSGGGSTTLAGLTDVSITSPSANHFLVYDGTVWANLSSTNSRFALGATTVGSNMFTLTNPSAITFPRFNADNSISALSASAFRTAIGLATVAASGSASDLSTGTLPDARLSSNIINKTVANSYTAGAKQTFSADATNAGLKFGGVTADPSSLSEGDRWYRSDLHTYKYYDGTTARYEGYTQPEATYAGTINNWIGTTAPSGTLTESYTITWRQNEVTIYIWLKYATNGAAITGVDLTLPSDAPTPIEPATYNTTNDFMYIGEAVCVGSQSVTISNGKCYLVKTGTGAYKIVEANASSSARNIQLKITYRY